MSSKFDQLREIDDYWLDGNLNSLKSLAELMASKLYPGVVAPLVETDDTVGSYLGGTMPYTPSATLPYISWCLHKYPPFDLALDESLFHKKVSAINPATGKKYELDLELKNASVESLVSQIKEDLVPSFDESYRAGDVSHKVSLLSKLIEVLGVLEASETDELNEQYLEKLQSWRMSRKKRLNESLAEISINPLVTYLLIETDFDKLFESFYQDFSLDAYREADLAKQVIKFRFLLHVVIIFLRVAGNKVGHDYTINQIASYRRNLDEPGRTKLSDFRSTIKKLKVNNTLPKGRELESIRSHAFKLMEKLNGRTKKYDLLLYLEELVDAQEDDFCIVGRLSTQKNIEVRAFAKALASWFCFYYHDYLYTSSQLLDISEFKNQREAFTAKADYLVEKITGIFFYDIAERSNEAGKASSYISSNTKEVYDEILEPNGDVRKYAGIQLNQDAADNGFSHDEKFQARFIEFANRVEEVTPEILMDLVAELEQIEELSGKLAFVRQFLLAKAGVQFWDAPFSWFGGVHAYNGSVDISFFDMPEVSGKELTNALRHERDFFSELRDSLGR